MDCQLRRVECPQGLQSCPRVSVIPIRADKNAAVCVADSSSAGSSCTYGMGIAQAVAQIDNHACGGTDKGPSIHSISGLSVPMPRWQQSTTSRRQRLTIVFLSSAVAFFHSGCAISLNPSPSGSLRTAQGVSKYIVARRSEV